MKVTHYEFDDASAAVGRDYLRVQGYVNGVTIETIIPLIEFPGAMLAHEELMRTIKERLVSAVTYGMVNGD